MSAFRPGWLPSILVALLLPLFCGLGVWQLQRAEEKRVLLASFEARRQAAPISLVALEQGTDPTYRRVHLQGHFDGEHSLLLDNRIRDGHAGVELLQPFYDQPSGLWVLLNRGWLPWPDRRLAPQYSTPDGPIQLDAWVYVAPPGGLHLQGKATAGKDWPQLISEVDSAALWRRLGRGGLPLELRLESGLASYRVDWPVVAMSPAKHQGYAAQWFAMAVALLGLFIYLGVHNAREKRHAPSHHPA